MVSSFFASVAHLWYVYYLVAYSVCLRRLYALRFGAAVPAPEGQKGEAALAAAGGPIAL
jgi:hypothetical protein